MFCLLASVVACSCEKDRDCDFDGAYQFEIPATLSPTLDTFQVGDTIRIQNNFSDQVYDKQTNQTYSLENFKFYPGTDIIRLDSVFRWGEGTVNYALDDFKVLIPTEYDYQVFTFSDGAQVLTGQFNYSEGRYKLDVSLIPQKKGLFVLLHNSSLGARDQEDRQDFTGRCSDSRLEAHVKLNSNSTNNINFLQNSIDPFWKSIPETKPNDYYHSGGYAFYVID